VHVTARRLEVHRIVGNTLLLSTVVAVGRPAAPTPLGRDFFVQGRYMPGVSHGCVRVSNAVVLELERLAPLGTPVDLLP
jgi:hypothetical protein